MRKIFSGIWQFVAYLFWSLQKQGGQVPVSDKMEYVISS